MRRSSALAGIIAIVLLIFGLVDWYIARSFRLFWVLNLAAGTFALVIWLFSGWESMGAALGKRTTRYGANAAIYSIGFIALLVAINYVASRHHRRIDLTEQKIFSLSDQSVKIVRDLQKPLVFYGFFEGGENPRARALYESYAYASPKVTFQMVDPDKHPELAEKFKVSVMGTPTFSPAVTKGRVPTSAKRPRKRSPTESSR